LLKSLFVMAKSEIASIRSFCGATPVISVDAAFVGDRFAVAVGHQDAKGVELDAIRGWHGSMGTPVQGRPDARRDRRTVEALTAARRS
jgi:hypothetical protein